jgi:hypothetical protein
VARGETCQQVAIGAAWKVADELDIPAGKVMTPDQDRRFRQLLAIRLAGSVPLDIGELTPGQIAELRQSIEERLSGYDRRPLVRQPDSAGFEFDPSQQATAIPAGRVAADRSALAVVLNYLHHLMLRGPADEQLQLAVIQLDSDLGGS